MTALTVLLVDDNPDDRALVERELKQHISEARVEHAGDRQSFQAALEHGQFDVVVTDYLLRWSTGTEVLREVKRRFPQRPVIMFTGSGNEEIAVSAMKEGLDDYITKTVKHYPRIPYAVLACFDKSRHREQLAQALERETLAKVRLEIALASAHMGTWQMDLQTGRIIYSRDVGPMFGRPEGFQHESLDDALADMHPDDREGFKAAWKAAISNEGDFAEQFRTRGPDNQLRWIASSGRVVGNGSSSPNLIIGTVREITHEMLIREQMHRQQQELQTILDVLPVGVAISRDARAGHITLTNYFAELLGVDPDTNVSATRQNPAGRPFESYKNGAPVAPADLPMQRAARLGIDVRGEELDLEMPDGRRLNLLVNASPLRAENGGVSGAVGALMDVTAIKKIQRELEVADRQKTEFLSVLSHELRNPMAAIGYAAELLRQFGSPEVITKARMAIERQTVHMGRLLDDLLDLSRITRNKIELNKKVLDIRRVVQLGYETAKPQIEQSTHTVTMNLPPEPLLVHGDEIRLTQVITNVLANAAKFTPPGGFITIQARQTAKNVIIQVSDNGVGIEQGKLEHIFEMFYQGESKTSGGVSGLGIGLAVVRDLVNRHGGAVSAFSDGIGRGTEITIELPAQAVLGHESHNQQASVAAIGPALILVADDNMDAADALSEVLRIEGYVVRTAYDGQSAMEMARHAPPDLAILDIGMPLVNGNELARWMRQQPWANHATLIAVTGWGQAEDRKLTAEAGFDLHLVKPVAVSEIVRLVSQSLAERRNVKGRSAARK